MVRPEFVYSICISGEQTIFLHEVAPRSVLYGQNFIDNPSDAAGYTSMYFTFASECCRLRLYATYDIEMVLIIY